MMASLRTFYKSEGAWLVRGLPTGELETKCCRLRAAPFQMGTATENEIGTLFHAFFIFLISFVDVKRLF
jgi:hypothetical protein